MATEHEVRALYQKIQDKGSLYTKETIKNIGIEFPDYIIKRLESFRELKDNEYIMFAPLWGHPIGQPEKIEWKLTFTTAEDLLGRKLINGNLTPQDKI